MTDSKSRDSCSTALLREFLSLRGLGLTSVVALDSLPSELSSQIRSEALRLGFDTISGGARVVTVGNIGGEFWQILNSSRLDDTADPVDAYSAACVREAFAATLANYRSVLLYPGDCRFSLQQLGSQLGWGLPSWLGISIHPEFGTWFAFRAVAVTDAPLPEDCSSPLVDACVQCRDKDCVSACPVDAPGMPGTFNIDACVSYRLTSGSHCASTCVARTACPAGESFRYPGPLITYFYQRSGESLRRWRESSRARSGDCTDSGARI